MNEFSARKKGTFPEKIISNEFPFFFLDDRIGGGKFGRDVMTGKPWALFFRLAFGVLLLCRISSAQASSPGLLTYHEQFLYSIVILEYGPAQFIDRNGQKSGSWLEPGTLLPTESIIEVGAENHAQIRLGCGSIIRLSPTSRLKIFPYGLELLSGSILARHVGDLFPLKIDGAATLLVSQNSLIDAERTGETILARVQIGTMRTSGQPKLWVAGQSIEATKQLVKIVPFGPIPRAWNTPELHSNPASQTDSFSEAWESEMSEPEPAAEPSLELEDLGVELPPTPDAPPANPKGDSPPGTDWTKDPIPEEP
jgi:hypothetical protein